MKKILFDPSAFNQNHLPTMVSRRIFGSHRRGNAAYKSQGKSPAGDDDDDDDEDEDEGTVEERLASRINKRVAKALKGVATPAEIAQIRKSMEPLAELPVDELRAMANADTGVMKTLATQGLALQKLQDRLDKQPEDMSVRAQCKRFLESNKDVIKNIRGGNSGALKDLPKLELQLRAVSNPMLPSNVMPSGSLFITRFEVESGASAAPLPIPTFWDYIRKGATSAETYVWVNKIPREGAAAFIAPGVYKPNISFKFDTDISNAKKVAASEKMATELLDDIDGFVTFVEAELKNAVLMEVNAKLTTGVSSSTTPAGIRTLSVAFTNPGLSVTDPNYWDCIKAVEVALTSQARFAGRQVVIFVNQVDMANASMTKAISQGQVFQATYGIKATIVEDANIPVGHIQAAILDAYKVLIYKPFSMAWGWENDDFTKNLVTVIGEMRLHQFVKDSDAGAFIYDTFSNIKTAIAAA